MKNYIPLIILAISIVVLTLNLLLFPPASNKGDSDSAESTKVDSFVVTDKLLFDIIGFDVYKSDYIPSPENAALFVGFESGSGDYIEVDELKYAIHVESYTMYSINTDKKELLIKLYSEFEGGALMFLSATIEKDKITNIERRIKK